MYSTLQVSKITGASLRQLQYWDEQKLVVAKRFIANRGWQPRQYTREQVNEIEFTIRARKYAGLRVIRESLVASRRKTISLNRVIAALKVIDSIGITL